MAPRGADKLRLSQTYRRYVTVSFPSRPRKEYRFFACPRKGYRSLACPRKVARTLHCAPDGIVRWISSQGWQVSFVVGVLKVRHGYGSCTIVLGGVDYGVLGFDLRVAGCYPASLVYIVCTFMVGILYVGGGVGHSFVVGVGEGA